LKWSFLVKNKEILLKQIPHVDKLMQSIAADDNGVYRHEVLDALRDVLAELRENLKAGGVDTVPCDDDITQRAVEMAVQRVHSGKDVRRVINATGVILHSNLGRACLSKTAAQAVIEAASSYCTLEYDIEKGKRGNRTGGVEKYLRDITGCRSSLIVNNNAAAVLLILSAVVSGNVGGNVLVSRGELVEIGGGFRVPEIISQCGCVLREVGTTNKTRISDYSAAIDEKTVAILKVHSSNFKVVGFTESVSIGELALLGKKHNIPVIEDIGSGALIDVRRYGLNDEPLAKDSLLSGADIVSFSADKLLGGLQCGIILGSERFIAAMKKHPLYRAFRVDKMTIAALEGTLRMYGDIREAERNVPVLTMLSLSAEDLRMRAQMICKRIVKQGGAAEVVNSKSIAGGGSVPGLDLESYAVVPRSKESTERIEKQLRALPVPIIGHIENDRLLIDVRTIFEEDFDYIIDAVTKITTTDDQV